MDVIFPFELLSPSHSPEHTHASHQHRRQRCCLWQMSAIDPCDSLNISYLLFKCLASILEHKKIFLVIWTMIEKNDSEPSCHQNYILSAKVASDNEAWKPGLHELTLSPSGSFKRWALLIPGENGPLHSVRQWEARHVCFSGSNNKQ